MKKALILIAFIFVAVAASSCKSQKSGCGLTGSVSTEIISTVNQA